jgi:4-carboxymuconolactone decarboxylase
MKKEGEMASKLPYQYLGVRKRFKKLANALDDLGKVARQAGPLDEKTSHLIQLAASASIRSEGSVHSHTRRALAAGAKPEEIYHTIILLTSTIGFPTVSAALSWADDIIKKKRSKK